MEALCPVTGAGPYGGGMYQLIVFIHVLGAVTWVGGGIYAVLVTQGGLNSGDSEETTGFLMDSVQWAGSRLFGIAPPVTLLAGIALVMWNGGWQFSHLWIWLALVLSAATAIVGAVIYERASKELRRVLDESGRSSPEFSAAFRRMTRVSFVDLALVFAILGLMVFKPVV